LSPEAQQLPSTQTFPFGQTWAQEAQLLGSLVVLTQPPGGQAVG
jgi:hypothetical protein